VAVTVTQAPFVVLDEDYRIVGVGPAAAAMFGPLAGRRLWECFPGSEPLFKPYYEQAREGGEPVEFVQFYEGTVARIRAVPTGDRLELYWERLLHLDTLTLDGVRSSIAEAIGLLDEREADILRREMRGILRVIEGGT
jgi:PAS fold